VNNVAKEMEHLNKLAVAYPDKRFHSLWNNIVSEAWLTQAWEEIRKNQGSQTPGIDRRTGEDMNLDRIRLLSKRLHEGTYRPKSVRRVYIPKSNGKLRPLGIPTIEDRLVQQALRMVLEPVFEADFLPCSHGFRQGHSPHTALRDVARMYPRVSWVIEGDIVGCFDNIPHNGLMKTVARRIMDGKILSLVSAFLKVGYMENWQFHTTHSGTPQGGIVSPLLCNIFGRLFGRKGTVASMLPWVDGNPRPHSGMHRGQAQGAWSASRRQRDLCVGRRPARGRRVGENQKGKPVIGEDET
jgi:RNA-directed DNA polymerase